MVQHVFQRAVVGESVIFMVFCGFPGDDETLFGVSSQLSPLVS